MSQTTRNLALPLIAAGQAQKHVTHNEALTLLDALAQLACLDRDLAAPPVNPAEGDRYIVAGPAPTGAWAGLAGQVVRFEDAYRLCYVRRPEGILLGLAEELAGSDQGTRSDRPSHEPCSDSGRKR